MTDLRDEERLVRESYDRVPYPSSSNHHSHPDRLATMAVLHGLEPAPPARARVLELGCADGGNLIPMAAELTGAHFVGIDLSPRQIESGRAQIASLGLANIELHAKSILDLDESLGTFDYVICHGVFSWVVEEVQEKILAVCKAAIAPQGVAFISYNTYPGWHLRRMVRELVRYHTRKDDDPEARASKSVELVQFLATVAGNAPDAHAVFYRAARDDFEEMRERPSYMLHEYLEETNAPTYFHEFARRAAAHGLQYLGESEPELMEVDNLPRGVADRLRTFAADRIELEQYLDFVLHRSFRRTLLCHDSITLDPAMHPDRIRRLFAASAVLVTGDEPPDLRPGVTVNFRSANGRTFAVSHPLTKATFVALGAISPRAASFDELAFEVTKLLGETIDEDILADVLHSLFWNGVVDLHVAPPQCVEKPSERPRATELARRQAEAGELVTNQRRRVMRLDDPIARFLLRQLDGTRDRAELVRLLDRFASTSGLTITSNGEPVKDPARIPTVLQAVVEHHLRKMAEFALLVG